jgi:hypothetical protein
MSESNKICCIYLLFNEEGLGYIGKTKDLHNRLNNHKHTIKYNKNCSSKKLGLKYDCLILEEVEEEDLVDYERYYYDMYYDMFGDKLVNDYKPLRTLKEYYETHKQELNEKNKEYRQKHKEEISEYQKEYNDKHKEEYKEYAQQHKQEIKEYQKEYNETHKQEIKEYQKEYNETHKQERKEYNETHKEELSEYRKEYRQQHKEEIKKYKEEHREEDKQYRQQHKQEIKEYYETHKKEILKRLGEKIVCECGIEIKRGGKSKHIKSQKHLNKIK